jgi:hypothetical protein
VKSKLLVIVQQRKANARMAATGSRGRFQKRTDATEMRIADFASRIPSTKGSIDPSTTSVASTATVDAASSAHTSR